MSQYKRDFKYLAIPIITTYTADKAPQVSHTSAPLDCSLSPHFNTVRQNTENQTQNPFIAR